MKNKNRMIFILAIFLTLSGCSTSKKALRDTFPEYGYIDARQEKSLEYLCEQAQVLPKGQTLSEKFPKRSTSSELLKDTVEFIELTQQHFWLRKKGEERWQAQAKSWMLKPSEATFLALKDLDMVDEVLPKNHLPDVICVLGGPMGTMENRLGFLAKLLNSEQLGAKHIVLLAGERYVSENIDGSKKYLQNLAKKLGHKDFKTLTETDLIKEAFKNSGIKGYDVTVIDTPKGNLLRPTTETTTLELVKWLKTRPYKSVLFISNQPYVLYQQAVIAEVLQAENCRVDFSVVGAKAEFNAQALMESLGSYLWAKTPQVVRQMRMKSSDEEVIKRFKSLYQKNPVISQHLEY